jgi:hypothetical protein
VIETGKVSSGPFDQLRQAVPGDFQSHQGWKGRFSSGNVAARTFAHQGAVAGNI